MVLNLLKDIVVLKSVTHGEIATSGGPFSFHSFFFTLAARAKERTIPGMNFCRMWGISMHWNAFTRFHLQLAYCTHEKFEQVAERVLCIQPAMHKINYLISFWYNSITIKDTKYHAKLYSRIYISTKEFDSKERCPSLQSCIKGMIWISQLLVLWRRY